MEGGLNYSKSRLSIAAKKRLKKAKNRERKIALVTSENNIDSTASAKSSSTRASSQITISPTDEEFASNDFLKILNKDIYVVRGLIDLIRMIYSIADEMYIKSKDDFESKGAISQTAMVSLRDILMWPVCPDDFKWRCSFNIPEYMYSYSWCIPTGYSIHVILDTLKSHDVKFALEIGAGSALLTYMLRLMSNFKKIPIQFAASDSKVEECHHEYIEHVWKRDAISAITYFMDRFIDQNCIALCWSWARHTVAISVLRHILSNYKHMKIILCTYTEGYGGCCEGDEFFTMLNEFGFTTMSLDRNKSVEVLHYAFHYDHLKIHILDLNV